MGWKLGFNDWDNTHNGKDDKKTKTSKFYVKKFFLGQGPTRVVLDYITFRLEYNFSS